MKLLIYYIIYNMLYLEENVVIEKNIIKNQYQIFWNCYSYSKLLKLNYIKKIYIILKKLIIKY